MLDDPLARIGYGVARRAFLLRLGRDDLVDQDICAPGELHEVWGWTRVAREHDGPRPEIDAVAQRGSTGPVIDEERRHAKPALRENDPLADITRDELDPLRRQLLVHVAPDVNVERVRPLQVRNQVAGSRGPPDRKRPGAAENP